LGQQQLLLIVLGVIIVGIAVILGIYLFNQQAIDNKRDLVINEGLTIANYANQYFRRPKVLGGGQGSFIGWDIPPQMKSGSNGTFEATKVDSANVEIIGTGNDVVSGIDMIKVKFIVTSKGTETLILN